jgi:phage recombination protein Bet
MTPDQIGLLKSTICKGATDDQLNLFIQVCSRTKLDPFSKQIYGIVSGGRLQIQVSIDGLRLIAERSGKYRGQVGPYFCGKDGNWTEVWLEDGYPIACKVGVLHKDFDQPLFAICKFTAYAQENHMWKKMPEQMIAKVAESLALRKAFPQDLSGIYSDTEMGTQLPASVSTPQITAPKDIIASQTPVEVKEPAFDPEPVQSEFPVEDALESYTIPFGKDSGKTIMEVGVAACLERVKWFESRGDGKPLSPQVSKFKEMVNLAVQAGLT